MTDFIIGLDYVLVNDDSALAALEITVGWTGTSVIGRAPSWTNDVTAMFF